MGKFRDDRGRTADLWMTAGLPSSTGVGPELACGNLPQSGRRTLRRDAPLLSRPDPGLVTWISGYWLCFASAASLQIQTGKRCDTGTAKKLLLGARIKCFRLWKWKLCSSLLELPMWCNVGILDARSQYLKCD